MATKRKYELRKRAEALEETRRRIVEATVELHRTVGPAGTRVSEIARRAGVQRVTVYNHFPDEAALVGRLLRALARPAPRAGPAAWAAVADPRRRLRAALRELYAWYRETEPMTANVLRDLERMPALREVVEEGLGRYLEAVQALLAAPFGGGERVGAAVRAATDFHLWRALAPLGDGEAAELAAGLVELAAG